MPPKKKLPPPDPGAARARAAVARTRHVQGPQKTRARAPAGGGGKPVRMALPAVPVHLADDAAFAAALVALERLDAPFVATIRAHGDLPRLRRREPGFAGLAQIIVSQQVSTASADAIFGRVRTRFPALDAAAILAADDADLRVCGLSAPKMRTLRAIAEAVRDWHLDIAALADLEAEAAHAALCAIKGIGPWTADIFLLFCLGHGDAWPVGDLALQEGARLALGLAARPDAKALQAIGERWRPLRGVVAHCLWAHYAHRRARPATLDSTVPEQAATPRAAAPKRAAMKGRS